MNLCVRACVRVCVCRDVRMCVCALLLATALPFAAHAADLKGIARVRIAAKHVRMEMHFAVVIKGEDASFTALDDFGGTPFVIIFAGDKMLIRTAGRGEMRESGRKLKSILSMPLTQGELLAILSGGSHPSRRKLEVITRDFLASPGTNPYPQHVLITRGKNQFELTWQSVKFE